MPNGRFLFQISNVRCSKYIGVLGYIPDHMAVFSEQSLLIADLFSFCSFCSCSTILYFWLAAACLCPALSGLARYPDSTKRSRQRGHLKDRWWLLHSLLVDRTYFLNLSALASSLQIVCASCLLAFLHPKELIETTGIQQ